MLFYLNILIKLVGCQKKCLGLMPTSLNFYTILEHPAGRGMLLHLLELPLKKALSRNFVQSVFSVAFVLFSNACPWPAE